MKMLMFDFRDSEKSFFQKHNFQDIEITFIKEPLNIFSKLSEQQLEETDIVSVFIGSDVSAEVLKKFKNLRIVATRSTGYNHIDIDYCRNNNITVFNVNEYGQKSVAQFTFGMIISLVRNLLPAYLDMQKGILAHANYEGRNLNSMTLGIFGSGSIGEQVAKIANFFNMKILVNSYTKNEEINGFVEYVEKDELLKRSDIISLHIPYTKENYHFLANEDFNKMKQGVYIINTARGELLDIVALYENLISGKVKGAGLDVLECEYLVGHEEQEYIKDLTPKSVMNALITKKLLSFNNVLITPHIAYNTRESIEILLEVTFNNIRNFVKGMHENQVC